MAVLTHYNSFSLAEDVQQGNHLGFPWPYVRPEHVSVQALNGEPLMFGWTGTNSVMVLGPTPARVFIIRRTPLATGLTDFGTGGRLIKDSVLGEYTLRQNLYIQEKREARQRACIVAGGTWVPNGAPVPVSPGGQP